MSFSSGIVICGNPLILKPYVFSQPGAFRIVRNSDPGKLNTSPQDTCGVPLNDRLYQKILGPSFSRREAKKTISLSYIGLQRKIFVRDTHF